jgi:glycosyltransferase involved in cell wall biosynthesis
VVIDDGSTDNTKAVVDGFIKDEKIDIRYYYQENSGKHIAHNNVLQFARGMFLLVLDSDDACKDNTLEILLLNWHRIPDEEKEHFIGVTGLCEDQHGKIIGDYFPYSPFDSNSVDKYYKYNIKGEKSGILKTKILKQYKFPEKKANYYPEAYLWFTIATKYKTRYINEVVRIYYIEAKESIMKPRAMPKSSAWATSDYNLFLINNFFTYSQYQPSAFLKYFVLYTSYASYSGQPFVKIIKQIKSPLSKLIAFFLYPVSIYYRSRKNLE